MIHVSGKGTELYSHGCVRNYRRGPSRNLNNANVEDLVDKMDSHGDNGCVRSPKELEDFLQNEGIHLEYSVEANVLKVINEID